MRKITIREYYVDSAPFIPLMLAYIAFQKHSFVVWFAMAASLIGAVALQYVWDALIQEEREKKLMAEIDEDRKNYGW
jgi:hypothetical protein